MTENKKIAVFVSASFLIVGVLMVFGMMVYFMSTKSKLNIPQNSEGSQLEQTLKNVEGDLNGLDVGTDAEGFSEIDQDIEKL